MTKLEARYTEIMIQMLKFIIILDIVKKFTKMQTYLKQLKIYKISIYSGVKVNKSMSNLEARYTEIMLQMLRFRNILEKLRDQSHICH